jgi:protein gp37
MSKTKIQWTDAVWNPVVGCRKVSDGCKFCYAEVMANRLSANPATSARYAGTIQKGKWTGEVNLVEHLLDEPRHWTKPRRVFVDSMSDLFHESVPFEFILSVYDVMLGCPQHTFQVLTKRPERALEFYHFIIGKGFPFTRTGCTRNIWLGVSVENQKAADERIPILLRINAVVRFLSCEPLLGPILLDNGESSWLTCNGNEPSEEACESYAYMGDHFHGIDWVICGGESGTHARPMHLAWARALRDQCQAANVPFFFKQWGEWLSDSQIIEHDPRHWPRFTKAHFGTLDIDGTWNPGIYPAKFPIERQECMYHLGRKNTGDMLDGKEWHQFPGGNP